MVQELFGVPHPKLLLARSVPVLCVCLRYVSADRLTHFPGAARCAPIRRNSWHARYPCCVCAPPLRARRSAKRGYLTLCYSALGNTLRRSLRGRGMDDKARLTAGCMHSACGPCAQARLGSNPGPTQCRSISRRAIPPWPGLTLRQKSATARPFETCKAFAFHVALEAIAKHLERPAYDLLG